MSNLEKLKKAILDLHGCDGIHAGSIAVHETFQGKTVWQGIVEVCFLPNHPKAREAYAWSYKADTGETRYVAVLGVPPIKSANDAVRAYIAMQTQK
jgi:hypothetical protein